MKGVFNAGEQGQILKTHKSLRRFMKSEKETIVSMTHSPLKSSCERKERNRIVARRGSRVKLMFFSRRRDHACLKAREKKVQRRTE